MPHYLIRFSQTPEAWAKLIKNPEDRREAVRKAVEPLGGKLHGYWYAFGEHDGVVLLEGPDNVSAAAISVAVSSTGRFRALETTVLLTVEEMLKALKQAQSLPYRPPGSS